MRTGVSPVDLAVPGVEDDLLPALHEEPHEVGDERRLRDARRLPELPGELLGGLPLVAAEGGTLTEDDLRELRRGIGHGVERARVGVHVMEDPREWRELATDLLLRPPKHDPFGTEMGPERARVAHVLLVPSAGAPFDVELAVCP